MGKNIHKPGRKFPVGLTETGTSIRHNPKVGKGSGMPVFQPKKFGDAGSSGSAKRHNP